LATLYSYNQFFKSALQLLKQNGLYRYFLTSNKLANTFPTFKYTNNNSQVAEAINCCSNDYLAQSAHKKVIAKAAQIIELVGVGSGGTRNIAGTTIYHKQLEETLANWHKKQAALLFNSAYMANVTTLQTLGKEIKGLIFFSDEKNHASIIEGIRGCKNEKKIFNHNNLTHLEALLQSVAIEAPKLIVFESVYSMDATIANIPAIVALAKKYNALTYVDEVHGVGMYGKNGAGIAELQNIQADVDIVNGTLSKAIGCFGGYIAGATDMIDFIRSKGSGFIFTTSLPPAIAAAAITSIQIIEKENLLRKQLFTNAKLFQQLLEDGGIDIVPTQSHITIVPIGSATACKQISDILLQHYGIYVQPIQYPTVPLHHACLRIIISAKHTPQQIKYIANSLNKIWHEDGYINRQKFQTITTSVAAG
jgi:5-aminolevulinate synthase